MALELQLINDDWEVKLLEDETRHSMAKSFRTLIDIIVKGGSAQADKRILTDLQRTYSDYLSMSFPDDDVNFDKEVVETVFTAGFNEVKTKYLTDVVMNERYLEQKLRRMSGKQIYAFEKHKELSSETPPYPAAALEDLMTICMSIGTSFATVSNISMGQEVYNTKKTQALILELIKVHEESVALFDAAVDALYQSRQEPVPEETPESEHPST